MKRRKPGLLIKKQTKLATYYFNFNNNLRQSCSFDLLDLSFKKFIMFFNSQKKFLFLIIFTSFIFLLGNFCFAQINTSPKKVEIFVAPAISNLELEKGEVYNGKILLQNKNNFSLPVKTKFVNFDARDEVGGINYEKGEGANWFFLKRKDFALKPNERRIIDFQIRVPKDVSRGGYYINWIFEPQLTVSDKTKTIVISRVSSLFLISVGKRGKSDFKIIETEIPKGARYSFLEKIFNKKIILNSTSFPIYFRVQNNDIYHLRPGGTFEVFKGEKSIGKVSAKKTTILPKKIRKISVDFKSPNCFLSNFYFGKHKAVLTLKAYGAIQKKTIEIFILPLKGIIFIKILLILFLAYFIIVKAKQKKEKRKKLFNKARKKT